MLSSAETSIVNQVAGSYSTTNQTPDHPVALDYTVLALFSLALISGTPLECVSLPGTPA